MSRLIADISMWATVLLTRSSRLQEFILNGACIQDGAAVTLVDILGAKLTTLKISLDCQGLHVLKMLPTMVALRSLSLVITTEWESDTARLSLTDIAPLIMPNLTSLAWKWWDIHSSVQGLQYLAACRFDSSCRFVICFREVSALQMAMLNPLFLSHHSHYVSLMNPVSSSTALFAQSRSVCFNSLLPPSNLFQTAVLPPFLSFVLYRPAQVDELWPILDVLVKATVAHNTFVYICAAVRWSKHTKATAFLWERDPDFPLHEKDLIMTMRLIQYSRILARKGVTLADSRMQTYEGHVLDSNVLTEDMLMKPIDLEQLLQMDIM
jgi:hypothetical protein